MKNCKCVKPWKDYNINNETFCLIGSKTWFVGSDIIEPKEFEEHFIVLTK
jgi:hypothetical protein